MKRRDLIGLGQLPHSPAPFRKMGLPNFPVVGDSVSIPLRSFLFVQIKMLLIPLQYHP